MGTRKDFLTNSIWAVSGVSFLSFLPAAEAQKLTKQLQRAASQPAVQTAGDETFWQSIREQYSISPDIINLNNGGVNPQPIPVQEAYIKNYKYCNLGPSHYMWHKLDNDREPLRKKLAELAGCDTEELAINRNTTEGLNTIIFGLDLKEGDEVVLSKYDYPNMMNAWRQRARRDKIVLKWIDLNLPLTNEDEIVQLYSNAITERTRIVHITHMLNWTGQILPAQKITAVAHTKGCEVILDASHSFAHIPLNFKSIGCDYAASSLHKWTGAPFGTGFMYIRNDKIKNIWPLLGSYDSLDNNIRKFETLGTRSFAAEMAVSNAISFHEHIGAEQKTARLRYLKDYWYKQLQQLPEVKMYTSLLPDYSCGIASFAIEGMEGPAVVAKLLTDYGIHTTNVKHEQLNGVRISPNVYTSLTELDKLVSAIKSIIAAK